jgi:hypothetical protein
MNPDAIQTQTLQGGLRKGDELLAPSEGLVFLAQRIYPCAIRHGEPGRIGINPDAIQAQTLQGGLRNGDELLAPSVGLVYLAQRIYPYANKANEQSASGFHLCADH